MLLVPELTPVTTPELDTVATLVVPDIQGLEPEGVPDPVSVVVDPAQTVRVPEIVGSALIVKLVELVAVPPAVVTVIFPVVAPDGRTAVMVVELTTLNDEALDPLNWTAEAPEK